MLFQEEEECLELQARAAQAKATCLVFFGGMDMYV